MRLRLVSLVVALLLSGCSSAYRARSADLADLEAVRERGGTIPATSFEDGEDRHLSLRARSILEVGNDYGNGLRRVHARDGRTPLAVGLGVAAAGLVGTALVAATHPERQFLGELQYVPPIGLTVTGGVVALFGAAVGSPEAE